MGRVRKPTFYMFSWKIIIGESIHNMVTSLSVTIGTSLGMKMLIAAVETARLKATRVDLLSLL